VPVLLFAALALAPWLAVAAFGAEGYVLSLLSRVMIFAIAAIALDLILGYGALVSFGHAAFLGIGAYSVGILSSHGIEDASFSSPSPSAPRPSSPSSPARFRCAPRASTSS
jgi:branched-chain amino acid transport system permease protein